MKSQSFDDWLLSDEPLNQEQEQELKEVLSSPTGGEELTPLVQSYKEVDYILRSTPQAIPVAGFTQRWQARLAEKKARQTRLMIGLGAGGSIFTAIIISLAILAPQLDSLSLARLANSMIYDLILFTSRAHELQNLASFYLPALPPALPIAIWMLIATSGGLLALAWVYAMWRIIVPKGIKG